ncbi:MAG: DUF1292 domain-containing protein [Clostridia bacterium]|nr:DUF1292 domain-containing protein [Clostridia bacterium]MBR2662218.1 DUF1292 domain-containing protein [Clostridia bacterium]MBR3165159.1 DUF1292 domain-containing protein [Lachnospiraceae bacterium]MBR7175174.1 DUF1292 domain-containing protein [Clostridia bacterium]
MSEKNFNNEEMEMDEDLIVFEDEDGNEITFVIEDYFFYNGDEYAILTEYDTENDNVKSEEGSIVCKIEPVEGEDGEEDEEFVPVEDEEFAEKLIEIANAQLAEDEEEE